MKKYKNLSINPDSFKKIDRLAFLNKSSKVKVIDTAINNYHDYRFKMADSKIIVGKVKLVHEKLMSKNDRIWDVLNDDGIFDLLEQIEKLLKEVIKNEK